MKSHVVGVCGRLFKDFSDQEKMFLISRISLKHEILGSLKNSNVLFRDSGGVRVRDGIGDELGLRVSDWDLGLG